MIVDEKKLESSLELLCCPLCRAAFIESQKETELSCPCGETFPINQGIIHFFPKMQQSRYTAEQIEHLRSIEKKHFWFKARRLLILTLLQRYLKPSQRLILDVGCGTGETLLEINAAGYKGIGIDLQSSGIETQKKEIPFFQASAHALPFKDKTFDAVILADILEHIEESALSEIDRVLSLSGIVVITVPAYQSLWSKRDERAGHLRRYTKKEMKRIAYRHSWQLEFLTGYQFLLFPLVYLMRRLKLPQKAEERVIPGINQILYWLNALEVKCHLAWPWGTSIVGVMRKK